MVRKILFTKEILYISSGKDLQEIICVDTEMVISESYISKIMEDHSVIPNIEFS